jgi:hypothetical protein
MKSTSPESATLRSEVGTSERTLRALAHAGSQITHAVGEVLSGALGSRLPSSARRAQAAANSAAQSTSRLREVLERDRALIATLPDFDELHVQVVARDMVQEDESEPKRREAKARPPRVPPPPPPARKEKEKDRASVSVHDEPTRVGPAPTRPSAPASAADDAPPAREPIRTRTMARLLASQGHVRRALTIYEELLERDPEDLTLLAEIDAVRARVD